MSIWLTIIIAGLLTYATRLSFIYLHGKVSILDTLKRALRFVPPAVFTAIFLPELLVTEGMLNVSLGNGRLIAGLLAIIVAWRTKNVILTIVVGMLTLWLFQAMFN
jgi:branched-subunit amino acid transport protein